MFGEQFRAARQNNKLSQEELGKLIGASKQQISKYEKAVDTPSLSRLVHLSAALNIPLSFFLERYVTSRGSIKSTNRDVQNILLHAYGVLNQPNRMLLLAIAEALVECSSANGAHRPKKTARSLGALAGEVRGPATNS